MNELEIKDLTIHYITRSGTVRAVNNVSFSIGKGETLGLVGETGAGKTTTALGILRLVPNPPGKIIGGEILFEGKDLCKLSAKEWTHLRATQISYVLQGDSLLPNFTVLENICLPHRLCGEYPDLEKQAMQLLEEFGMEAMAQDYPTNLSGGERRRVAVARAVVHQPKLVIADEPTSDLDEENTALIMEHFQRQADSGKAVLISTHDLSCLRPNMVHYKMNKGVMQKV